MKRFYEAVTVAATDGGFAVLLDDRPVHTPAKQPLIIPERELADSIAVEWRSQGTDVNPADMLLTRLANTAVDRVAPQRDAVIAEAARYAETDLLCYRADDPPELVAQQNDSWQPLIEWARDRYGAEFAVATGVVPVEQPAEALGAIAAALATFETFPLTAVHSVMAASGSAVIGLALAQGRIDAATAWEVSQLDESYQVGRWGTDDLATQRREALRADISAAGVFLACLGGLTDER